MEKRIAMAQLDHRTEAVAERIHRVFQRSYRKEAELIGMDDFPPLRRTAHDLKETGAEFFGCWKRDVLVAVAEVTGGAGRLDICSFVVDPDFFRQGFAGRLLGFVLDSCSWQTAVVETAVANGPAIALYGKFGFVEEKTWQTPHGIFKVMLRANKPADTSSSTAAT